MQSLEPNSPHTSPSSPMFAEPTAGRGFPATAVVIAAVVVGILATVLVVMGRRHHAGPPPNTLLPAAAYAPNLVLSNVRMSESDIMSGGKQTYIEGHIANHGPATVTGILVQVVFANDALMPPQIETVPLNLIYMREPYLDTRPVNASPLAPGAESDFRLIFEDVGDNWNQQMPQIRLTQVATR